MAAMQARLSTQTVTAADGSALHPLQGLSTREHDDPAIALLDAWACLGDVLSFYQERIANEGYLRTARERRSLLEMGRLLGYRLKPGVAASVFLAYTLDKPQNDAQTSVLLPVGTRAQSIPGADEAPQSFETSEQLLARAEWNNLRARSSAPLELELGKVLSLKEMYFQGTSTNLKAGDKILLQFEEKILDKSLTFSALRTVASIEAQSMQGRTRARLAQVDGLQQVLALLLYPLLQACAKFLLLEGTPEWQNLDYGTGAVTSLTARILRQAWLGNFGGLEQVIENARRIIAQETPPAAVSGVGGVGGIGVVALVATSTPAPSPEPASSLASQGRNILGAYIPEPQNMDPGVAAALETFETTGLEAVRNWQQQTASGTITDPSQFIEQLLMPPVQQARSSQYLTRSLQSSFPRGADNHPQILFNFAPRLRDSFYRAWQNASLLHYQPRFKGVYAMRANLGLFGMSAAKPADYDANNKIKPQEQWPDWQLDSAEVAAPQSLWLESSQDAILPGSLIMVTTYERMRKVYTVQEAQTVMRTAYGVSGKSSRLDLGENWWPYQVSNGNTIIKITDRRPTLVLAQSEELSIAPAPLTSPVSGKEITLDGLYADLQSGRWIILSGERADIAGVEGVRFAELMMISGVVQEYNPNLPGDSIHTRLLLATATAYSYKRESLTIYGNVVKATHGESRSEVLGSGDAAQSMQSFNLKQAPLTFVAANNAQGINSSLRVLVDNIDWEEAPSLYGLDGRGRQFISKIDHQGKTTVCFGNGKSGARLPTGVENVRAEYRQGIGLGGNVRAGQISLLMSRPLGVREVINPLRASGGADAESRDQARANLPLAVMALDRLVSLPDYAYFARSFAGIGKALAARISDGRREIIHLTIAGSPAGTVDAPIDESSDLFRNLKAALLRHGDPDQPLLVQVRELMLLVVNAKICLQTGYQWDAVEAQVRQNLLAAFSFEQRALGQPALLCEVIACIQNVPGVKYVDVDHFGGIPEKIADGENGQRRLLTLDELAERIQEINDPGEFGQDTGTSGAPPVVPANQALREAGVKGQIRPAQLVLFSSALPDTIILNQMSEKFS